jgi:ribosomal-protein-alanine N-acetyltransferase
MHSLTDLGRTPRLWVRAPVNGDLPDILRLWTDEEITRHIGGPRGAAQVVETFERYAADPLGMVAEEHDRWWSLIESSTGKFAGLAALLEKEVMGTQEMELSYFLLPEFWGKGYATEAMLRVIQFAVESLELTSMIAVIDPHNAPSQRVAERLGMRFDCAVPRSDGVTRHIYRLARHSAARPDIHGRA